MAESAASTGWNTLLEVRGGPAVEAYVAVAEVIGFTPPSSTRDEHEVTHMQSDGNVKEYIPGSSDPGSMVIRVNYVPGSATDLFLLEWDAAQEKRDVRITYVSGRILTNRGFVQSYVPDEVQPNAPMTATLTIRASGAGVWS